MNLQEYFICVRFEFEEELLLLIRAKHYRMLKLYMERIMIITSFTNYYGALIIEDSLKAKPGSRWKNLTRFRESDALKDPVKSGAPLARVAR